MDRTTHDRLHLADEPAPSRDFPECMREEVIELARRLWEARVRAGLPGDDVKDWLEAEEEVLEERFFAEARFLPGGNPFESLCA